MSTATSVMAGLFVVETALKVFGLGAWGHPHAYFKSWGNVADFAVVVLSCVLPALFLPFGTCDDSSMCSGAPPPARHTRTARCFAPRRPTTRG